MPGLRRTVSYDRPSVQGPDAAKLGPYLTHSASEESLAGYNRSLPRPTTSHQRPGLEPEAFETDAAIHYPGLAGEGPSGGSAAEVLGSTGNLIRNSSSSSFHQPETIELQSLITPSGYPSQTDLLPLSRPRSEALGLDNGDFRGIPSVSDALDKLSTTEKDPLPSTSSAGYGYRDVIPATPSPSTKRTSKRPGSPGKKKRDLATIEEDRSLTLAPAAAAGVAGAGVAGGAALAIQAAGAKCHLCQYVCLGVFFLVAGSVGVVTYTAGKLDWLQYTQETSTLNTSHSGAQSGHLIPIYM